MVDTCGGGMEDTRTGGLSPRRRCTAAAPPSGSDSAMLLHTTMELFLTQMQADDFRQVSVKHMTTYRTYQVPGFLSGFCKGKWWIEGGNNDIEDNAVWRYRSQPR